MENSIKNNKYFNKSGHLNDLGIALCSEALIDESKLFLLLPKQVLNHVEECFECKGNIIEVYQLLKDEDDIVRAVKQQKNTISVEQKSKKQKPYKISRLRIRSVLVAASLIIVAAVSFLLLYISGPDNEKIFDSYFEPYPNILTEKGNITGKDELLNLGMYYYDLKNYDTAIIVFNKLLETDPTNETILFYGGITYLGLNKSEDAIRFFSLLKNNDCSFAEQVKWYCSLSYILQNDINKAIPVLQELKQGKGYYANKAGELLSKLE